MTQTPINDHLNRSRTKCGLELWAFLLVIAICGVIGMKVSVIAAVLLAVAVPSLAKYATHKDPRIFRLWILAFPQKAYYDPFKQKRAR
jgi:hypothetical protein